MKYQTKSLSVFASLLTTLTSPFAVAQETSEGSGNEQEASSKTIAPEGKESASKESIPPEKSEKVVLIHEVPVRSLLKARLHPAVFPDEASVRCSTNEHCLFGFSYGLALGADVVNMLWTPLFENASNHDGRWITVNVSAGFTILNNVDDTFYANVLFGYRFSEMEDKAKNYFSTGALWGRLAYAQELSRHGSIGIVVTGDVNRSERTTKKERLFLKDSVSFREAFNGFHEFQRQSPLLGVNFHWDWELYNWHGDNFNWPGPLRIYSHVEPYFALAETRVDDVIWQEKIVGIKVAPLVTFESAKERVFGRYAVGGGIGLDFGNGFGQLSTVVPPNTTVERKPEVGDFSTRSLFKVYLDLRGSFQF